MDKKAFTLIELLVVIAVVGILVLLAAPRFTGYTQKAELIRIQHDTKVMEEEVETVLINGDDEFNEWENNMKDLNQLIEENELFENKGYATELETKDGHYKIIPEEYKDKINTKLKGTFYANSGGKVYYENGKGPGYSDEEIDDLINNCDFIPIADADELNNVRYKRIETYGKGTKWVRECEGGLDKKYIQVKNVDLSGYSEEGWDPIGTRSTRFTGTYDGGNYVITGLEVKGEDKDFQGLFGYTNNATISNVGLIDNKVTGRDYVGGLVGNAGGSTNISNSYATGSVTGSGEGPRGVVGGLVGGAGSITITNSYATGSVTGRNYVGGLVGDALSITMENSYATGSVTGSSTVGGLLGYAKFITITNSYATGSVEGRGGVGGLVGQAGLFGYADGSTNISNSYTTGSVTGTSDVGGLVGYAGQGTTIENSYATGEVTGGRDVGGLVGEANIGTTISSSYATGSVTGTGSETNIGGLVGLAMEITITNSYATGSVTGKNEVGGLVGWVTGGSLAGRAYESTIENSYATGPVTGTRDVGGLVGGKYSGATVTGTHSYWDKDTTGQSTSAGGIGKTTAEMKKADTYSAWGTDVWNIVNGEYPTLR